MATRAGTAYVEVKYDPDSIRRLRADTLAEGKKISKSWDGADKGLIDFGRSADKVNKTMSGGPFGLFDTIGNVGSALLQLGGFAQKGTDELGKLSTAAGDGEGVMASLGSTLSGLAPLVGVAATGFATLGAALLVLPALFAAVTFVAVALLDTLTILSAVVVAFLGPLAILAGLLGGLGAAFFLAGQRAIKGGGIFKDFAKQVEELGGQFHDLVYTLGARFLPLFERLAGAAKIALTYLGQVAKLPLNEAFKSLATQGVALLSKFLYGVANVLKRPFRLAVEIAFGSAGVSANQTIAGWWDSLTNYLFGYTKTRPIHIGSQIVMDTKHIQGALKPLLDFFHRQHFVKDGIRWAHEIIDGLVRLWNNNKDLRDAVKTVLRDAGHQAGRAFRAAFFAEMHAIPWKSLGIYILHQLDFSRALENLARRAFAVIKGYASSTLGSIAGAITAKLGAAWNAVKSAGSAAFNAIGNAANGVIKFVDGIISAVQNLIGWISQIHWPSPPHVTVFGHTFPHTGGLVLPGGGLALAGGGIATGGIPGRDSVPAMLTPGELVLNKQQQLALLHGGTGQTIVNVEISRDVIAGIARVEVIQGGKRTARVVKAGRKW